MHFSVILLSFGPHFLSISPWFLSPGYLGDGDVVTQAIHDAKLLLRSHGTGGRERERERERDRDGGGKMVSWRSLHAALH